MKRKTKIICAAAAALLLVIILTPKKEKQVNVPSYGLSPEGRQRLYEPSPDTYKTELQEMNERAARENSVIEDERLRERVRNRGY